VVDTAAERDITAMQVSDHLGDGQAEAVAFLSVLGAGAVSPVEAVKDVLQCIWCDTLAMICYCKDKLLAALSALQANFCAFRAIFNGVVQQDD
jgi:hypothetical protein